MKKVLLIATVATVFTALSSQAGFSFHIDIASPRPAVVYRTPPPTVIVSTPVCAPPVRQVCSAPAPVVAYPAPAVVYAPPPVVYAPAPVVYAPAPVYVTRGHGHYYDHHRPYNRGHRRW